MNIRVHIERLILDGLPVTSIEAPVVQTAIEQELARLLAEQRIEHSQHPGSAMPHLRSATIHLARDAQPAPVGHQIARVLRTAIPVPAKLKGCSKFTHPRPGSIQQGENPLAARALGVSR